MIELKNIHNNWDEFTLHNINLKIEEGEYFVILGPTGSGKTLILETLAGFHFPKKGKILINGHDVTSFPPEKRKVGFIYQDYSLFPHITVKQNIEFGLKHNNADYSIADITKKLNINHLLHRMPDTLSGGEKQRAAIARALAIRPPIILLDEPLAALDMNTRDTVRKLLLKVNKEFRITMLHVTHDQSEAMMIADRIAVLMDGKVMQVGEPKEIFSRPASKKLAEFVGCENIIKGTVLSHKNSSLVIKTEIGEISAIGNHHGNVMLFIRPEEITIQLHKSTSSARNEFESKISDIVPMGAIEKIETENGLIIYITPLSRKNLDLKKEKTVFLSFKATAIHCVSR